MAPVTTINKIEDIKSKNANEDLSILWGNCAGLLATGNTRGAIECLFAGIGDNDFSPKSIRDLMFQLREALQDIQIQVDEFEEYCMASLETMKDDLAFHLLVKAMLLDVFDDFDRAMMVLDRWANLKTSLDKQLQRLMDLSLWVNDSIPVYLQTARRLEQKGDLRSAESIAKRVQANCYLKEQQEYTSLLLERINTRQRLLDQYQVVGAPKKDLSGRFCPVPFERFDICENGDVYICCSSFLPVSVGNAANGNWTDVWNSEVAVKIRESILEGTFLFCDHQACPAILNDSLEAREEAAQNKPKFKEVIERQSGSIDLSPSLINLSYDKSCNLWCPSCRTERHSLSPTQKSQLSLVTEKIVNPVLSTASTLFITGSGDPFASDVYKSILSSLNKKSCPNLSVDLLSNGVLFDEKRWSTYPGIHDMVRKVYISVDGTTESTYNRLRRGGNFKRVMANLRFLSSLRKQGAIKHLGLIMIVQTGNFFEMREFVRHGIELEVDDVSFNKLLNWGTYTPSEYEDCSVFNPAHPRHGEFLTTLESELFDHPIVSFIGFSEEELKFPPVVIQPIRTLHTKVAQLE